MTTHMRLMALRVCLGFVLACRLLLVARRRLPWSRRRKTSRRRCSSGSTGTCYSSWSETGWYWSPAVADLDGDGTMEVIASAYSVVIPDGATRTLVKRIEHDAAAPGRASWWGAGRRR